MSFGRASECDQRNESNGNSGSLAPDLPYRSLPPVVPGAEHYEPGSHRVVLARGSEPLRNGVEICKIAGSGVGDGKCHHQYIRV